MIRLLIFDFDGLILETEQPVFQSWQELYAAHNCQLSMESWGKIIGMSPHSHDPFSDLEKQAGRRLKREDLLAVRMQRELELVYQQEVLPGVRAYLDRAQVLGLKLAVASSSTYRWVGGHLERLGLLRRFDVIKTSDDVTRTKPAPDLFLAVLEATGIPAGEALVFEDSPNGILAAKRAGITCVVVPNPLTRQLDISMADLHLESLADLSLDLLLQRLDHTGGDKVDAVES